MELRKDGFRLRSDEEESLDFLQKMVTAHKMDINVTIRNAILSCKAIFKHNRLDYLDRLVIKTSG